MDIITILFIALVVTGLFCWVTRSTLV